MPQPAVDTRYLRAYAKAIVSLQEGMQDPKWSLSDEALLAVAVLAFYEKLIGEGQSTCYSHRQGIEAILLARPVTPLGDEVTSAMLYQARDRVFCVPVARGTASPFDLPHLRDYAPIARHNLSEHFEKLRHIGNQVFIRLPCLIALVRTVRHNMQQRKACISKAIKLARELLDLLSPEAESEALHQVTVVRTSDRECAGIHPWSFKYRHVGEMKAAVLYWEMHIFLARLCLKLDSLASTDNEQYFYAARLKTENSRMITNVLMSWQFARSHSHGGLLGFTQTLAVALWGAMSDIEEYRGVPSEVLRMYMLRRFPDSMQGWPSDLKPAEMDEAAELFAGGPLRGFMVETYACLLY